MRFPQGWELIVVLAIFLLLFGSKKLPDAARGLGRSMRIFKSEVKSMQDDDTPAAEPSAPQAIEAPPAESTGSAETKRSTPAPGSEAPPRVDG